MKVGYVRGGKRYKKNLRFVSSIVMTFGVLITLFLVIQNRSAVDKEICLIEEQNLSRVDSSVISSFDQITHINNYFASIVMQQTEFPLPDYGVSWYTRLNDRATLCITLLNYIRGIYVKNGQNEYQKGLNLENPFEISKSTPDIRHFGEMNAVDILFYPQSTQERLYFRQEYEEGGYDKNDVLISADIVYLSQSILGTSDPDVFRCVVDADGGIILTDRADLIQKNIFDYFKLTDRTISEGSRSVKSGGKDYFISMSRVDGLELYSVSMTKRSVYGSYYSSMVTNMFLIGMLFIGVSIIIAVIIARRTYGPIKLLIHSLDSYFPQNYLDKSIDEINYLTERFHQLYAHNTELNEAVSKDIISLRNQQVIALQAQISPHFIYNTLDAINWISLDLIGIRNPISICVLNTADILRSCMDASSMFDTLSREIEITKKYIEVLKIRYNNSFDVNWEVDQSLLQCRVLKICMQPIVENTAFHGLSKLDGRGKITVRINRVENDTLAIVIGDNGVGISPENLAELKKNISESQPYPSRNIGIRNVNLRLKLLYGDRFGVFISSVENQGTTCTLLMPIEFNG